MPPRSPRGCADREGVALRLQIKSIREWTYSVEVRRDLVSTAAPLLQAMGERRCLVVTTPAVHHLYGDLFRGVRDRGRGRVHVYIAGSGEAGKTLEAAWAICRRAAGEGVERNDVLIGIGGGVCTDLTTVAASLVRRGMAVVKVP